MSTRHFTAMLALAMAFFSAGPPAIGAFAADNPAAAPAAKAATTKIDGYWQATGNDYADGAAFKRPIAWAAGQYVVMGRTLNGKRNSVTRTLIARKEGDGWVLETSSTDSRGVETIMQVTLSGYDQAVASNDPSKLAIARMKMRDKDGKVTVIEKDQLAVFGDMMKQNFQKMLSGELALKDGGAVTVPAGNFAGTKSAQTTVTMFGVTSQVQAWYNASVPLNGIVKSATLDGKDVSELLAFGFDGKAKLD